MRRFAGQRAHQNAQRQTLGVHRRSLRSSRLSLYIGRRTSAVAQQKHSYCKSCVDTRGRGSDPILNLVSPHRVADGATIMRRNDAPTIHGALHNHSTRHKRTRIQHEPGI